MNDYRLYTIKEVANILNLSEHTIRRKIRLKEISAEKNLMRLGIEYLKNHYLNMLEKTN